MSHGYPCEHPLCGFPKEFTPVKIPDDALISTSGDTKAHRDMYTGCKFAVRIHDTPMDSNRQKASYITASGSTKRREDVPVDFIYKWGEDNEAVVEYFWEFLQSRSSWSDYYQSRRIPHTFDRTGSSSNDDGRTELFSPLEGKRCKNTGWMGTNSSHEEPTTMERGGDNSTKDGGVHSTHVDISHD